MIKTVHIKYLLFFGDIINPEYSLNIFRNTETSIFMKSPPMEADLFLADGQTWQTDMTSLIGACRNFANGPKNGRCIQRVLLNYKVLQKKDNNFNTLLTKNVKIS